MPISPETEPVAVITGGARGIGLAIGRWFLAHGYGVALLDIDRAGLDQAAAGLAAGPRLMAIGCDVSAEAEVTAAAAAVMARWGRVDALVNNAGVAVFKPALATSLAEWRAVMATNLDGTFLCSQAFGTIMQAQKHGAIVNIASISGLRASTLRVAYGTSKAAIIHLTRQYAAELGSYGVRVNAVCPGPVETEMARQVHTPAVRADYYDAIPLGRYGTPEEMAALVGFLCGRESSYLNGQCIANDGGFDAVGVGLPTFRRDAGINRVGGDT
ncbi:MAG: SDR family oxidoreductase [Rhodospirillales bacterium]|nr:SDR family oxidoreductase [Rhodospirillales bacterium]